MDSTVIIRHTTDADLPGILSVQRTAFPDDSVADLTGALLSDPSSRPIISLIALADEKPIGHILFTAVHLKPETLHRASVLAPLAVVPECQRTGIGGRLVSEGLSILARSGISLVFVLGYPSYYPRFGFIPAGNKGFAAPYPIPEKDADAWMVLSLHGELPTQYTGTVMCAKALDHPEHWRE